MTQDQQTDTEQTNATEAEGDQQYGASNGWDRFLDRVRLNTPDVIVNEGGRLNFALRAAADALSIKSGLRPAILNDESLHLPYFEENPGKLPKGFTKFEKGMHLGYASPHRAIGGAITLGALLLGTYYGEKPMTEEEKQAQSEMPVGAFVKKRLRDSLNPKEHATATAGMATIANGAMLAVAGMKQFSGFKYKGQFSLRMLPLETIQGLMTMLAGGCLQFIPNREYAWQVSHSVFLNRIPVAAGQAYRAWGIGIPGKVDPGDWEQGAKFVFNQASNVMAILYGGVKKENGEIIRVQKSDAPASPSATVESADASVEKVAEKAPTEIAS